MLVLHSSLRQRFGYQVSYVLSKAEGNVDNNGFGAWLSGTELELAEHGADQRRRRADQLAPARVQGLRVRTTVPRIDVMLGWLHTFGLQRPSLTHRTRSSQPVPARACLPPRAGRCFLQPRGTRDGTTSSTSSICVPRRRSRSHGHRFGVYADVVNLFNTATVAHRRLGTRIPPSPERRRITKAPTGVQAARQVTFGGRWMFWTQNPDWTTNCSGSSPRAREFALLRLQRPLLPSRVASSARPSATSRCGVAAPALPVVGVRQHVVAERQRTPSAAPAPAPSAPACSASSQVAAPESRYALARKMCPSAKRGLLSIDCLRAPIWPSRSPTCS